MGSPAWGMARAVCLAAALGGLPGFAWSADPGPAFFDIQGQPLNTALEEYSIASGVQVLYDSRLAVGRTSSALYGDFPPETALRILLAGTGLIGRYTGSREVVITEPRAETVPPEAAAGTAAAEVVSRVTGVLSLDTLRIEDKPERQGNHLRYAGIVQSDIQRALRLDKRTRNGRYRIGIKLWVAEDGTVLRTEIVDSSGNSERDEAVALVLADMVLSRKPPVNMPQPIRLVISAWSV